MPSSKTFLAGLLFGLANFSNLAHAQTWSACNPTNDSITSCPPNPALGIPNATFPFVNGSGAFDTKIWNATNGATTQVSQGRAFTVQKRFDSPTIQSNFYIFFGRVSVIMRAATGQGIVSSIVLESDDLDEVDWEWIGGNNTHVETNYFGKGNTTAYDRAIWYPVENPQTEFHNYTVNWSSDKLEWWIDGNLIRTLAYGDALGGKNFPQTPMNVRLGIWAGGDPSNNNGTIEWAGGLADFSKGPYTMVISNVEVADASTGSQYVWTDKSGSWQSIKAVQGDSKAAKIINTPQGTLNKYAALSPTMKIAVIAGVGGAFILIVLLVGFCCIKQRKVGRSERRAADAEWEKNANELQTYRSQMTSGGFAMEGGGYNHHR